MAELENTAGKKAAKNKKAGFFKSLKSEKKKITWYPKKTTLINSVWVTIAMVVFAAVTALVDYGFIELIRLLAKLA